MAKTPEKRPAFHPTFLAKIEASLGRRLKNLSRELDRHELASREGLPEDSEEAAAVAEEIERVEAEESRESEEILETRRALRRLKDGTYGVCTGCAKPIAPERLRAVPWTPRCLACEKAREAKLKKRPKRP